MPETVSIQYGDLFEFLEDYRANFSQLSYSVAMPTPPLKVGDDVTLQIAVPVMDDVVTVHGRMMAAMGDRAGLQLNAEAGDGLPRLEGFYRFVGRLVESMLVSGRFKVAGQWTAGAAPAAAPTAGAAVAAAPAAADLPAATSSGTVTRQNLTQLFMDLYSDKAVGVLQVQGPEGVRRAWMKQGGIVAWESEPVIEEECLGVLLARAGKLSEEQLKQTLQMMNETGMKQGECLIEMGVFTFPQVVMSLMTQVELITRNLFQDGSGTWSFHPMEALTREFVTPPLKSPGFLFKFFKRFYATVTSDEVNAIETPLMDRYTVLSEYNWDDFRLSKTERALVEIIAKRSRRYRQMFSVSNVGRAQTTQLLLALIEIGGLRFQDAEDQSQVLGKIREELERKLTYQREQNPFERLEVHWTSRTEHVEQGHKKLRREYENYGRGANLPPELDAMRNEILANVDEAYEALKTVAGRQAERKKYFEPQQHEFSADLLFRQGEMLMVRHKWPEVIDGFERAIELMPNVPKYRQFLKQAKSKAASGRGGDGGL